jgi:hypothetical protein
MSVGDLLKSGLAGVRDGLAARAMPSDPPKIVGGDATHGDVNILKVQIFKGETGADIKGYVTEIHIFESIVSPVIYCEMFVKDGINLQNDLKIDKSSVINLEFITPGASDKTEFFFRVNEVLDLAHNTSLTLKTFRIQMVSIEGIAAMGMSPNKLEGFSLKDTSGKLITKILKEHISELPEVKGVNIGEGGRRKQIFNIENGHGVIGKNLLQRKAVEQNRKPFELIHQLALLTNKSPEGDSLYTFFERKDGYYFKPIEKLIRDGKKLLKQDNSELPKVFFYDHLQNQSQEAVKVRNILAYNISSVGSGMSAGRGNSGTNTAASITNPQTGVNTSAVTPSVDKHLGELTSLQALKQFDTVTQIDNIVSSEYDHLNEVLVKRRQLLSRITTAEAQIFVYGDSFLSVGDLIECIFPTIVNEENKEVDVSGYYLITHLRHIILNTDRPQHVISCNLMRAEPNKD